MSRWLPGSKSRVLERWGRETYGERKFDAFVTNVGIVATHLEYNRPMVFKNDRGARRVSSPASDARSPKPWWRPALHFLCSESERSG